MGEKRGRVFRNNCKGLLDKTKGGGGAAKKQGREVGIGGGEGSGEE